MPQIRETRHKRQRQKLQALRDAVAEADDSYHMTAETNMDRGTVSVTIDSTDWIFNEGEIGDCHFHVYLGPRGGLRFAYFSRTLLDGRRDYVEQYDKKRVAWRRLLDAIRRAK